MTVVDFIAVVCCCVSCWLLCVFVCCCVSCLLLCVQIVLMLTSKEQRQQALASGTVEEAISAIKTVVAFGGEEGEVKR